MHNIGRSALTPVLSLLALLSASAALAQDAPIRLGASVLGLQFPAVVALKDGMEEAAAELGAEITVVDAAGNAAKQANDISDLLALDVDGIIINALDSAAIEISAKAILESGTALGSAFNTIGSAECAYPGAVAHAGFDETGWAKLQGEEVLRMMDAGNVAIIDGAPGLQASRIRHDAFVTALGANPNIKVVASQPGNFDRTAARTAAENILQANEDLDAFYVADDNMAMGVVQAVQATGRDIAVLGIGGSIEGLKAVQDGQLHSTVYSSLKDGGREIVKAMVQSLTSGQPAPGTCLTLPQALVTQANAAEYVDRGEF